MDRPPRKGPIRRHLRPLKRSGETDRAASGMREKQRTIRKSDLSLPTWFGFILRSGKSIDDFCQEFHGGSNHGPEVKTYTFDDLVKTLNALAPFDWVGFFHSRLTSTSAEAPLGGIENGGWKVMFNDKPSKLEGRRANPGEIYSIGLHVGNDGVVTDTIVGSPAFQAGISPQMKIVGVNGRVYTEELLSDAIKSAKDSSQPITLLVVVDDYFRTCNITYHDGIRYPHLERVAERVDYIDELIKPHVPSP